jgi:5-methylcytosine-specific restriction endonuclease McrA
MRYACLSCGALSHQKRCPEHRHLERNGSTRKWRKVRAEVLERDGYRCHYCGEKANTVDHVKPVIAGGTDDAANLRASCAPCNRAKGSETVAK